MKEIRYSFLLFLVIISGVMADAQENKETVVEATNTEEGGSKKKKNTNTKRGREALKDPDLGSALDPHPDPNDEDHNGMIYVGRIDEDGSRIGFDQDNAIKYIYGTSFDESHKDIEEEDLLHHSGPDIAHDLADRGAKKGKTKEEVLRDVRHGDPGKVNEGPKPFGHFETNPLDGGLDPPKVVSVHPFFFDATPVTNKQFGRFYRSTSYRTEAEHFGWSFVLSSFLLDPGRASELDADPDAEHWIAVDGAYWRAPEGPGSTYKKREHHPVVHVTHRDAAEYCKWMGRRLPGEREYEMAARGHHRGPTNRTLYPWGEDGTVEVSSAHANLWGKGNFPHENLAEDKWRGTSPVSFYPPNDMGFHDVVGNVWEWQRGGKHKDRILRGGSYVDTADGSTNHAATLGARATTHGTTSTGNIGFRCAKVPKRRVEYHYKSHDELTHGKLALEDEFGKQHAVPQRGWEDQFVVEDNEDDDSNDDIEDDDTDTTPKLSKRKVVAQRSTVSSEL